MDLNSVAPMPDMAPIAEFDKSPPSPTELSPPGTAPMDDLPPPPTNALSAEEGQNKQENITISESAGSPLLGHSSSLKRKKNFDEEEEWGCGTWCEYLLVVILGSLLLVASLTLVLFWTIYYRHGFAWKEDIFRMFNLHPVLMIGGYIFCSGFSLLLYRICRCCRKIYVKLFHALLHALAIPCAVVGFLAVWEYHNMSIPPIPHFYSLHSWLGIATSGLFVLQFVVGFFSFVVLLCCEGATAAFRAALVPIHSTFGITTFMLAVATCVTGLTEKAFFDLGETYKDWLEEGIIINALAVTLVALGVLLSYAVRRSNLRGPSADDNDFDNDHL